ncbi:MAG: hypothetical protein QM598_03190, partial [Protaetiibacter sp.]
PREPLLIGGGERAEQLRLALDELAHRAAVDGAMGELVEREAELLGALSSADQERLAGLLRKLILDFD